LDTRESSQWKIKFIFISKNRAVWVPPHSSISDPHIHKWSRQMIMYILFYELDFEVIYCMRSGSGSISVWALHAERWIVLIAIFCFIIKSELQICKQYTSWLWINE
jgi:hypothetical protein